MLKFILVFLTVLMIVSATLNVFAVAQEHDARYYQKLDQNKVQCQLCPRKCLLKNGQTGYCRVRQNYNGTLKTLVYGQVCALNADPVEKKPLYHFLPGTKTLSLATVGCSMRCLFCQNWNISQAEPGAVETSFIGPGDMVRTALEEKCLSISYTYSEPAVFYEYMYDIAGEARKRNVRNILITSGHINPEPLRALCPLLDAANLDLKGFSDSVYLKMAKTKLSPILDALKIIKKNGVWLEVGYLLIPSVNDNPREIKAMADWIVQNLGRDVPLHFLRFFPQHKLSHLPPTPLSTMESAYKIAKSAGINYVYLGNVPGHKANNTYCPKCGRMIIERKGYFTTRLNIKNGRCKYCNNAIPGVWKQLSEKLKSQHTHCWP